MTIDVGPSNGNVRLALGDGTTLDAKANDNFHVYADAEQQQEVVALYSGDLPLSSPIDLPGSVAGLLLVSDGAARHTSLRATVECVCEDSASFEDAEGDGCLAYAQGSGTKHDRCASLVAPTDEDLRRWVHARAPGNHDGGVRRCGSAGGQRVRLAAGELRLVRVAQGSAGCGGCLSRSAAG